MKMFILVSGTAETLPRVTFIQESKKQFLDSIKKKIEVPYYVVEIESTDENYNDVSNYVNDYNAAEVLELEAISKIKRKPIANKEIYSIIKYIKEIG